MVKKARTAAEKRHLSRVTELGCIACTILGFHDTPSEIHHLLEGMGMGQRNDDYHTIPLCPYHHRQGPNAIHQSKVNFEHDFGTEIELLEIVNRSLGL